MSRNDLNGYPSRLASGQAPIPSNNSAPGPGPSQSSTQQPTPGLSRPGSGRSSAVSHQTGSSMGSLYYSSIPSSAAASMYQPKGIQKKIGPRPVTKWTQMYGKTYRGDWQQTEDEFQKKLSERPSDLGEEIHDEGIFNTLFPGLDAEFPRNRSQVSGNFRPLWADSESEGITPPRPPARLSAIFRSAFPQGVPSDMPAELQQAIMAAAMPVPNTATFRRASLAERISNASGGGSPPPSAGSTDENAEAKEESIHHPSKEVRRRRGEPQEQSPPPGVNFGPLGPFPTVRTHFMEVTPLPPEQFADNAPVNPSPEYLFGSPQVTILGQPQRERKADKEEATGMQPEF